MQIVALVGAARSGKTTVSNVLVTDHGFVRLRFADTLKRMLKALGLTDEQVEGSEKETPCALLGGKTPRWAMQSLGTEWGRGLISDELWVNAIQAQIMNLRRKNPAVKIVLDDCRFPNEDRLIGKLGGQVWRIMRPGYGVTLNRLQKWAVRKGWSKRIHPSELYWPDFHAAVEITNDAGLGKLVFRVNDAVRGLPATTVPVL